jgi:hypothetical protein
VDDIAAPLPPLPPLPASASPAPPEPPERRRRRRSRKTETPPVLPQATGGRRRSRSHRRGSRRVPLRLIAILGLTGALGAGGVYLLTRKDAGTPTSSRERPAAVRGSSSGAAEPASPRPVDNRRLYPKDEAFVASGVRFTVVPDPTAPWAREIAATDPGAGQRWQLVSVLYRNVSRQRLLAEELRFRMKDGANNVFPPVPGKGNGGSNLAPQTPIAVGTLVKAQLAFLVPADAGELSLIIDPGPKTRARVQLGPG